MVEAWETSVIYRYILQLTPADTFQIEMVNPKHLHVSEFISQAESMVRPQFVAMTRPTNALQILSAVRIPCP